MSPTNLFHPIYCICSKAWLFGLISVALSTFSFWAQAHPTLSIVTEDAPPLQYILNGEVKGKTTSIVKALLKETKLSSEINVYPWVRSFQIASERPNTLISPMIRSPEREKQFVWIGKLVTFNLAFIKLSHRADISINHIEQAKAYRLAVMRDDYVHHLLVQHGFKEQTHFNIVSQFPHQLKLLYANKIDTFIADYDLLIELGKNLNYDVSQLEIAYTVPNQELSVYLAANENSSPALIKQLKQAMITPAQ